MQCCFLKETSSLKQHAALHGRQLYASCIYLDSGLHQEAAVSYSAKPPRSTGNASSDEGPPSSNDSWLQFLQNRKGLEKKTESCALFTTLFLGRRFIYFAEVTRSVDLFWIQLLLPLSLHSLAYFLCLNSVFPLEMKNIIYLQCFSVANSFLNFCHLGFTVESQDSNLLSERYEGSDGRSPRKHSENVDNGCKQPPHPRHSNMGTRTKRQKPYPEEVRTKERTTAVYYVRKLKSQILETLQNSGLRMEESFTKESDLHEICLGWTSVGCVKMSIL